MRTYLITMLLCLIGISSASAQLNVQLLHQLVDESKSEHRRQQDAKNKQAVTTANEEVNKTQMSKLKTRYRELQSRFKNISLVINAAQVSIEAIPIVNEIIDQQALIYQQAYQNPVLIALAFEAERDMVERARDLSSYLYGLILSIGDLNQMKASDRRILFGHIITELRVIAGASKGLAVTMYYAGRRNAANMLNPFAGFINKDKQLIDDILRNREILKN